MARGKLLSTDAMKQDEIRRMDRMYRLKCLIVMRRVHTPPFRASLLIVSFCFFALITFASHAQQSIDLSKITEGKIEIDSKIITGSSRELTDILSLAIELTLHNIANARTTRTPIPHTPFLYHYLKVFPDCSYQVMQKEQIKLVYNPSHPDAIYSKDGLRGYVKYPDINIEQEYSDILEIVKMLMVLESGAPE
jgi:flagellar basal body rod protein FlgC